jgi:uncharacterized membrane protein
MSEINEEVAEALARIEEQETRKLITSGIIAVLTAATVAILALTLYTLNFGSSLSSDRNDWGVFGDYLGGILNPVVGIVTVYLVLMTLIVQRKELNNSLKEMKKSTAALKIQNTAIGEQTFQNTFFNWINSYNNIVSNTEWTGPIGGPPYRGLAALNQLYKHTLINESVIRRLGGNLSTADFNSLFDTSFIADEQAASLAEKIILETWLATKTTREDYFQVGFRSLLSIMSWVAMQPSHRVSQHRKYECFRIIESQLSNAEKVFLLYESWNLRGSQINAIKNYKIVISLEQSNDPFAKFMLARANHLSEY